MLGIILIIAPFLQYSFSQITCNELSNINETITYDYLEEIFEVDCHRLIN